MPRKRTAPNFAEAAIGLAGTVKSKRTAAQALDWFTNAASRSGIGTPNLAAASQYELVRFSYNYWDLITLYRNHWISRRIIDVPAEDMVRTWPKLTSDIEPKDITRINRVIRRTQIKQNWLMALEWARLFGGAGALMIIEGHENILDQPLDLDDVPLGGFKGVIPFDRWAGISPDGEVCDDISRPLDFNKPEYYTVRVSGGESFRVHSSRVLTFYGPKVPTPEREAQSWWGISELEPVYEELLKRDNMSWNILNLTFRANILGMKFPDLASMLSGLGGANMAAQKFEQRMSAVNHLISNQSLVPLPADGGIEAASYSFSGLSECYQQFQLDISGAAKMPVTRLWGRTISGLGQANDADERIYEERIATDNETQSLPQHEKLYPVLCMSELGEVPDDLDLQYPSVRVLDEKEKAELAKAVTDTVTVWVNTGLASPRRGAMEIKQASDLTGIGTNLTDEFIETLSDDIGPAAGEMEGLLGGEEEDGNLTPSSSPQKVLRESKGKAEDADNFEETDHPRDADGKFKKGGSGGGVPSHMSHFKQSDYKNAAQFIQSAWKENLHGDNQKKYSSEDIAKTAQSLFGTKTSVFTVNGYKQAVLKQTPAGQAATIAKVKGIKANNEAIAKAPTSPVVVKQAVASIVGTTTMVAKVGTDDGRTAYLKINNMPSKLSTNEIVGEYLNTKGLNLQNLSGFDPSKPAPPGGLEEIGPPGPNESAALQAAADKKAAIVAADRTVTKVTAPLSEGELNAVTAYTNGGYSVNNKLRRGKLLSGREATLTKQLDMAIAKGKLTEATSLWRGIATNDFATVFGPAPEVGAIVMDNGFISAAKSPNIGFYNAAAIQIKINMPAGATALDVQKWSNHSVEKEVMLPRGSLFKIKKLTIIGKLATLEVDHVDI